ncbi:DNA-3-methyladenine glycosylase [Motilibacter rhizosphaerae]|uniref:Putative 3-methyladenine DNA glycosylase n=1 Tax=Motilibacter rhizosphaerae TaxID=598652 RepID=A0A4V2F4H5_9ACTN|nr:DNA-3-methyladenine glycosylase [Motilibacter rhizosphaerae]RZS89339.1 DNA-3-methyladenine glycosylase [Motilibacter rhizosphaerae]
MGLGLTPFPRPALGAPAEEVAPALLGALLVSDLPPGRVVVRLTEVEAYAGEADPASHAFRGRTPRTAVMFGPAGALYVYFTYGMHWCANVVCGPDGTAAAVLLRAGEVLEGAEVAAVRRPACRSPRDLARGPARLCSALGIDGSLTGLDLYAPDSPLRLLAPPGPPGEVLAGPRVGVAGGAQTPWRFWLAGEPTVSAYKAHARRSRRTGESTP